MGGQYMNLKLLQWASVHLHLPASIATHPLIVHPHMMLSIHKNVVQDIVHFVCKQRVVELQFDAVEGIIVVEVNGLLHSMSGRNKPVGPIWPRWQRFGM